MYTLKLSEAELRTLLGNVNSDRRRVFDLWLTLQQAGAATGTEDDRKRLAFYALRVDEADALIAKLEQPLKDDTAQDANDEGEMAEVYGEGEGTP